MSVDRIHVSCSDWVDWATEFPDGGASLLLTDLPYELDPRDPASVVDDSFDPSADVGAWDDEEIDIDELARHGYRVLRDGGTAIVWWDPWSTGALRDALRSAGFTSCTAIHWRPRPADTTQVRWYSEDRTLSAVVAVKGLNPTFNARADIETAFDDPVPSGSERVHPRQMPTSIYRTLVERHSNVDETVVDFFTGSGTTAVACRETGRRFQGCEIDPAYVADANKRIYKACN